MSPERKFAWLIHVTGFVGAVYAIFIDRLDRPATLALLGAMMGLADRVGRGSDG